MFLRDFFFKYILCIYSSITQYLIMYSLHLAFTYILCMRIVNNSWFQIQPHGATIQNKQARTQGKVPNFLFIETEHKFKINTWNHYKLSIWNTKKQYHSYKNEYKKSVHLVYEKHTKKNFLSDKIGYKASLLTSVQMSHFQLCI